MATVPPDFGGLLGYWLPVVTTGGKQTTHAYLVRYGKGKPVEGIGLTPLNLLQARKTLDGLIEQGRHEGHITEEHERQSEQLPMVETEGADLGENVMPREQVDEIAGPD